MPPTLHIVEPTLEGQSGHCHSFIASLCSANHDPEQQFVLWVARGARLPQLEKPNVQVRPYFFRRIRRLQAPLLLRGLLSQPVESFSPRPKGRICFCSTWHPEARFRRRRCSSTFTGPGRRKENSTTSRRSPGAIPTSTSSAPPAPWWTCFGNVASARQDWRLTQSPPFPIGIPFHPAPSGTSCLQERRGRTRGFRGSSPSSNTWRNTENHHALFPSDFT